jgi:hypothetical protein
MKGCLSFTIEAVQPETAFLAAIRSGGFLYAEKPPLMGGSLIKVVAQ